MNIYNEYIQFYLYKLYILIINDGLIKTYYYYVKYIFSN